MRTVIYIDGFNLYYRMLKQRPSYKWLNPLALAQAALQPGHQISRVNYYTARISQRAQNPDAPARQTIYLSALGSVPEVQVHEGNFLTSEPWMSLTTPPAAKPNGYVWNHPVPNVVKVIKTEEKGSDVNLATHLVRDAFLNIFDVAVLITNDSDLVEPIKVVRQETNKRVGLLVPVKYPTASLMQAASFYLRLRPGHLAQAQFPEHVVCPDGRTVTRPPSWV
jgi:hypothetical protein